MIITINNRKHNKKIEYYKKQPNEYLSDLWKCLEQSPELEGLININIYCTGYISIGGTIGQSPINSYVFGAIPCQVSLNYTSEGVEELQVDIPKFKALDLRNNDNMTLTIVNDVLDNFFNDIDDTFLYYDITEEMVKDSEFLENRTGTSTIEEDINIAGDLWYKLSIDLNYKVIKTTIEYNIKGVKD